MKIVFALFLLGGQAGAQGITPFTEQEKLYTAGLAVAAAYTMFLESGREEEPAWIRPLPLDVETTELLGARTASGANRAKTWSDWGLTGMVLTPVFFPGRSGGEGRWQITQSYSIAALAGHAVKTLTARERPYVTQCRDNKLGQDCFSGYRNGSFFSGHAAFAFTSAGLMCAYRADALCPIGLAVASGVSWLRISGRQHYLSDVVLGGLVGWASGYHLSKWRVPDREREGASETAAGFQFQIPLP